MPRIYTPCCRPADASRTSLSPPLPPPPQRAVERVDTELGKTSEEREGGECTSETRALLGSFEERASSFLGEARPQLDSVLRADDLTQEACRHTAEVRVGRAARRQGPPSFRHTHPPLVLW